MYEKHFGLTKLPFNVAADPGNFYLSSTHQEALAKLHYGVESRKGLITVVGKPGTGKTTLLRMFVASAAPTISTAIIYDPRISWKTLLRLTLKTCGINAPKSDSEAMMRRLENHLKRELNQHRIAVLLIDEAQTLAEDVLEQLRLLSNIEAKNEKLLQIVLVGQPELEEKLAEPRLSPLKQRVALSLELSMLKPDEIDGYIQFMLAKAGYQGEELFENSTVERIALYSRGIPRLINSLCDNGLLATYRAFDQRVAIERIDKAAQDLKLQIQDVAAPSQRLSTEAPREPYLRDDDMRDDDTNDELWQTDFDTSVPDDQRVSKNDGGRTRGRAVGFFVFLGIIFIAAVGLIYSRVGGDDDTSVAGIAPQQSNVRETKVREATPEPVVGHKKQGPATETTGNPLAAPAETVREASLPEQAEKYAEHPATETTGNPVSPAASRAAPKAERGDARVFVHTPKYQDRPVVQEVGKALKAAGYELPDTRVAAGKTGGDVRFFFPGDRREADKIKSLVEAELRKRGFSVSLQLLERDGRRFQYAAPGKIEVWLPPLANLSKMNDS